MAVTVVTVHFHPDGTFDIDPAPAATGNAPLKFHLDDLHQTKIRGNVPLDDNTIASIDVTLKAVEPISSFDITDDFPVLECPSGMGHVSGHQRIRDAAAQGSATIHGGQQVPTSAVQTPFILDEHDTGNCLP